MKRWLLVPALVLSLAQMSRADLFSVGLGGGWAYLDGKDLKDASGFGGKLELNVTDAFGIELRAASLDFDRIDLTMRPFEAALTLGLPIGKTITPYIGAGVGYYMFDLGDLKLDDQVGYFPLAGLKAKLGRSVFAYAEARWLFLSGSMDASSEEFGKMVSGTDVSMDGIGINVGIGFTF